jgi:hypothetical protein
MSQPIYTEHPSHTGRLVVAAECRLASASLFQAQRQEPRGLFPDPHGVTAG